MAFKKVLALSKRLEDPKNPLLGPTLNALYFFGLWQTGSKFRTTVYNIIHFSTILFTICQMIDLYSVRKDFNRFLNNISLTILSVICCAKAYSYWQWQEIWTELAKNIAREEIVQMQKHDKLVQKFTFDYIKYTRSLTYMYWILVLGTNICLITTPFLKFISSQTYLDQIRNGFEPLPQIFSSWFPLDSNKMPGYFIGICFQIVMAYQGSGVLAAYDMNAVAIMSYFKGQMIILKLKCLNIFDKAVSDQDVLDRLKECHRHHTTLLNHFNTFNALLSPTMFIYVLLCSMTICGSVVQFSSKQATSSQKLWAVEYTGALIMQLILFCWHSNEVTMQSIKVDSGLYSSNWCRSNVRIRKQLLLLGGKLNQPFILAAGPFTTLSIPTFVSILKTSYSFYTMFSQIQDGKTI